MPSLLKYLLTQRAEHLPWTDAHLRAFSTIKEALASATLLAHPKPNALTNIMTNASETAVGAVLQQYVDRHWQPLSFFSKNLQPAETRYSTFDRELLAIYLAIKHFRYFQITNPLSLPFNSRSNRYTPRQCRHFDYISQFTTDLCHVQRVDNSVADALSRIEANALGQELPPVVDFQLMAQSQRSNPDLQEALAKPEILSLQLSESTLYPGIYTLHIEKEVKPDHEKVSALPC